jgi:hypothetical protein
LDLNRDSIERCVGYCAGVVRGASRSGSHRQPMLQPPTVQPRIGQHKVREALSDYLISEAVASHLKMEKATACRWPRD